jgi:hypothetical protein
MCQQVDNSKKNNSIYLAPSIENELNFPSVTERLQKINAILKTNTPVLLLDGIKEQNLLEAQQIAIQSDVFKFFYKDKKGNPILNEIFAVYRALPSDLDSLSIACSGKCYRVEMYNFPYNTSIIGIVNLTTRTLVAKSIQLQSAPDLPEHLKKIAVDIAIHHPHVISELGKNPLIKDAQMAYTKTALNKSNCERSRHLCVAPTFVEGNKALWTIIDLTELKLVGTRWTNVGTQDEVLISERTLQNEKVSNCYCKTVTELDQGDWKMNYMLTSSDGLKIEQVSYKNKVILKSAKLVDWHVSYSNTDGFGYSDGIGCPMYSLSAVVAWDEPTVSDLIINNKKTGFALEQKFQSDGWPGACNYNYIQRYEFYDDGRFRIATASIGRGCGNDGTYRPVFRIAMNGTNQFSQYDGKSWATWQTEKWDLQHELTSYTPEGFAYKFNGATNYFIEPSRGQFNDKSRGDYAFVYVTKSKTEEGERDLLTLGPCCNTDYKQGPEKFIEDVNGAENISNTELTLWYVPQMHNDNTLGNEYCWAEAKIVNGIYKTLTYPCFVGPMFVPIQ